MSCQAGGVSWLRTFGATSLLLVAGWTAVAQTTQSNAHQFVDDLGSKIDSELTVCYVSVETLAGDAPEPRCGDHGGLDPLAIDFGSDWATLEVEGPRHGPVSIPRSTLGASSEIRLPRKASLEVTTEHLESSPDALQVSLWDLADERWKRPVLRWHATDAEPRWVAARGPTLVSTSDGRNAPNLDLVDLAPGSMHAIAFEYRPGWSAVLRVQTLADQRPLEEVRLRLIEPSGWISSLTAAEGTPKPRQLESATSGLGLVEGLRAPYVELAAHHPAFRPYRGAVVGASEGTFTVHRVEMLRGASLHATVRLDDEPATGSSCRLVDLADDGSETIVATATGPRCVMERLAPGPALLRVATGHERRGLESQAGTELLVDLSNESRTTLDVTLRRLEISGLVERGGDPAEGLDLVAFADDGGVALGSEEPSARATTDRDGMYRMTLWRPAAYRLFVLGPGDVPAAFRRLEVHHDEIADFELARAQVTGRVVDDRGEPVIGATLQLRWTHGTRSQRLAKTDDDGEFAFALGSPADGLETRDPGKADLTVRHPGFEPRSLEGLLIDPATDSPPIEVVLEPLHSVTIDVQTPHGGTPTHLWALSFAVELDGRLRFVERASVDVGPLSIRRAAGPGRIFLGGRGCALSTVELFESETKRLSHRCPPPSNLVLRFDSLGARPPSGLRLILRHDRTILPEAVVSEHLRQLALPIRSSTDGTLAVPALAPGRYDLFLAGFASEPNILRGVDHGYLDTVTLAAGESHEQIIELDLSPSR